MMAEKILKEWKQLLCSDEWPQDLIFSIVDGESLLSDDLKRDRLCIPQEPTKHFNKRDLTTGTVKISEPDENLDRLIRRSNWLTS